MAEILLDIAFGTELFVAFMHVVDRAFVAPIHDLVVNLTGFVCATWASLTMQHRVAALAASAAGCRLSLSRRTARALRAGHAAQGRAPGLGRL